MVPSWRRGRRRCLRSRRGTWRHRASLCVVGVALNALGWLWWRAWFPVGAVDAAAVCVAGVALGGIECHFAWQVRKLATWTSTLRGRHGTWRHGSPFCVTDIPISFLLSTHNLSPLKLSPHNLSTYNLSLHNLLIYTLQLAHTQLVLTPLAHPVWILHHLMGSFLMFYINIPLSWTYSASGVRYNL